VEFLVFITIWPAVLIFIIEMKVNKWFKRRNIAVQIIIIAIAFIYGCLRNQGVIIYPSDEPAGFLWSTCYFNGYIIMATSASIFIGIVLFCIFSYFHNQS
jgi:hypothetical protein